MSENKIPADDVDTDDKRGQTAVEDNLTSRATWTRLMFMVICYILVCIAGFVACFVVVLGFLWVLFTGNVNAQIQQVGQSIAAYVYEILRYLTFNTDERPFPLGGEWPSGVADALD